MRLKSVNELMNAVKINEWKKQQIFHKFIALFNGFTQFEESAKEWNDDKSNTGKKFGEPYLKKLRLVTTEQQLFFSLYLVHTAQIISFGQILQMLLLHQNSKFWILFCLKKENLFDCC